MRRLFTILFISSLFCGIISCEKEDEGPKAHTLTAQKDSLCQVTLYGQITGLETVALDFECGIEFKSNEEDEFYRFKLSNTYSEDIFSRSITDIRPRNKYYYRTYYINQLLVYYGETKSFEFDWDDQIPEEVTTLDAIVKNDGTVEFKCIVKGLSNLSSQYRNVNFFVGVDNPGSYDYSAPVQYLSTNGDTVTYFTKYLQLNYKYNYYAYYQYSYLSKRGETKSFVYEWNGPDYVDLGLSVKWATYNIGATNPTENGDVFAWGETEPKAIYTWNNYKFLKQYRTPYMLLSKYITNQDYGTIDGKITLDLEDDAAFVIKGDKWRMPTQDEIKELIDNCTIESTRRFGLPGVLLTSKKVGYTDKSIFFVSGKFDSQIEATTNEFWTSTLDTNYSDRAIYYEMGGFNDDLHLGYRNASNRQQGRCIRPVYIE